MIVKMMVGMMMIVKMMVVMMMMVMVMVLVLTSGNLLHAQMSPLSNMQIVTITQS